MGNTPSMPSIYKDLGHGAKILTDEGSRGVKNVRDQAGRTLGDITGEAGRAQKNMTDEIGRAPQNVADLMQEESRWRRGNSLAGMWKQESRPWEKM